MLQYSQENTFVRASLLKKKRQLMYFPVNFEKFLRTPI